MLHIDEKFKDNSPVKTVENIKSILRRNGFETVEKWTDSGISNCFSNRITIAGTTLGTNGKGVTEELARASGYAEMMERLQSGYIGGMSLQFADVRKMNREELLCESGEYLALMAEKIRETEEYSITAEDLADMSVAYGAVEACQAVPLLDVMSGKPVYLPYLTLRYLYSSNGLAAGNSTEEAIVQGFSEIVERYCQRYFLSGKLTPPDVPEEYLKQFETAYSVIEQVRAAGFTVSVKDCSMAEGYPVVASVIIDPKTCGTRIMFGSSPVFEIALERSLTEAFQGFGIKSLPFMKGVHVGSSLTAHEINSAFVAGHTSYPIEFFAYEPSFEFQPFDDRSGLTNKDLVAYILRYLKRKGRTLLLRDMSHFGFPTYRLIVPGMSELDTYGFAGENSNYRQILKLMYAALDLKTASIEELHAYKQLYRGQPHLPGDVPHFFAMTKIPLNVDVRKGRFLSLVSAAFAEWKTGDIAEAYQYAQAALQYAPATLQTYFGCLCRIIEMLLKQYSLDEAVRLLRRFYDPIILESARRSCDGKNPFESFLVSCNRVCESCAYAKYCQYTTNKAVEARINAAVAAFDNDAAFENLRKLIAQLQE